MKSIQIEKHTLPMNFETGAFLDPTKAREFGGALSGQYCFAEPYPHIVIDDFLPAGYIEAILDNFPIGALKNDKFYEADYSGLHKRQSFPNDCNAYVRGVFGFFNSASVLQFLEGLSTIDGLIPDPYFNGGGFHEIARGGKLGIHADFRIHEQLHLNRRINMLIYLNKDWEAEFGGCLEIWDKKMKCKIREIAPVFNRCVIFNTDDDSYHGHPEPLNTPENRTRRSIALYYYTASKKVYEETPAHSTMYVARPGDSLQIKRHAVKLRARNYVNDWLPPILLRKLISLKRRLKPVSRR